MPRLLIMLSPPRSFSSVVSTMLGEHPDLYGFPELQTFIGDTVQDIIDFKRDMVGAASSGGPPGLLRTLAQLHDGVQTNATVFRAIAWLMERRKRTTKELMDYLVAAVAPKIGVEKSPITAQKTLYLDRAYAQFPDAFFLHLTRNPISNRASWHEFIDDNAKRQNAEAKPQSADRIIAWYQMHRSILQLTASLPLGQCLRMRGEDILSEPDVYLPQIAEWLGVRTDSAAIKAMMHPENSPYACLGPQAAPGGNDGKFMHSPKLREGRIKDPSLKTFFRSKHPDFFPQEGRLRKAAARANLRIAPDEKIAEELSRMAHLFGYQ